MSREFFSRGPRDEPWTEAGRRLLVAGGLSPATDEAGTLTVSENLGTGRGPANFRSRRRVLLTEVAGGLPLKRRRRPAAAAGQQDGGRSSGGSRLQRGEATGSRSRRSFFTAAAAALRRMLGCRSGLGAWTPKDRSLAGGHLRSYWEDGCLGRKRPASEVLEDGRARKTAAGELLGAGQTTCSRTPNGLGRLRTNGRTELARRPCDTGTTLADTWAATGRLLGG